MEERGLNQVALSSPVSDDGRGLKPQKRAHRLLLDTFARQ